MFYEPALNNHGLNHSPLKSCVVPRPIGWISTISSNNITNLTPFSYFNLVADFPAMVMFSCVNRPDNFEDKDTLKNIKLNQQFVVNMVSFELKEQMNLTSGNFSYEVSEADKAGLELVDSQLVKPQRVKKSPIALECELYQIVELPAIKPITSNSLVLGKILGIYIADEVIEEGKVNIEKIQPVSRLGYMDYSSVDTIFSMQRPSNKADL
ncbi:flavin reductase family protein [Rickettsiales endosymbiont of Stachyamoeba lipophora]|uniref:flavin reductase family protein n=1 Tax=Rickettsiales endosymbiont of Stachyamoeba lipophora TaxID=2486578 RepID=UPI000F6463EC|nr:flavin reductase family protein [Rickettsiales endosymbiont of Stachyamoeba lipophora]AZL15955.1 flavin reductase family protein [Rickettsiales endosymbiont of Stachyamoeba lipophora]